MPAFGRYRDKPQNRLPHHDRVSVCPLSVQTRSPNQCQAIRRDVRQSGQRRLLLDLTRVPNAWRRRRCNLDFAERQSQSAITLERDPVAAHEAERRGDP